jgi:hypothetical protein
MNDLERLDFLREARAVLDDQIRALRAKLEGKRPRRSRLVMPECGTESAYQRHRYYSEPTDAACRAAHAEHNRKAS